MLECPASVSCRRRCSDIQQAAGVCPPVPPPPQCYKLGKRKPQDSDTMAHMSSNIEEGRGHGGDHLPYMILDSSTSTLFSVDGTGFNFVLQKQSSMANDPFCSLLCFYCLYLAHRGDQPRRTGSLPVALLVRDRQRERTRQP